MSWKGSVEGYMERGVTWVYEGMNERMVPDEDSHLTWGLLFVEVPKMTTKIFDELTKSSEFDMVDSIDANTLCIKLFKSLNFLNPGCTPAIYSQAEVLKPPSGIWWHLPGMQGRNLAYPVCDALHKKYQAKLYWVIDMYPLKLAEVMTIDEFTNLAAKQRPEEYGHLRDASPAHRKKKATKPTSKGK